MQKILLNLFELITGTDNKVQTAINTFHLQFKTCSGQSRIFYTRAIWAIMDLKLISNFSPQGISEFNQNSKLPKMYFLKKQFSTFFQFCNSLINMVDLNYLFILKADVRTCLFQLDVKESSLTPNVNIIDLCYCHHSSVLSPSRTENTFYTKYNRSQLTDTARCNNVILVDFDSLRSRMRGNDGV